MQNEGGCYGDCYAAKSAKLYGYDFSKTVLRHFENEGHKQQVIDQIDKVKLDFVRIGCSGDPSESWNHAVEILKVISKSNKEIVIITKHWTSLTDEQLQLLSRMNVCINTSVSALDDPWLLNRSLKEYNRIKPYCKSILRIVSCEFNLENEIGKQLHSIQEMLFKNESTLDTVFRPSKSNKFVTDGIVLAKVGLFNGHKALISKYSRKTYTGNCSNCHEMCGINIESSNSYPNRKGIVKQLPLFKKR
jgi:hypothetical protein